MRSPDELKQGASRRGFIGSLCAALPVFSFDQLVAGLPFGVQFVNVAREAGLRAKTIFGGEHKNKFLLETTGCGCAFFDYDNDGWLDIFLVNGTRFETDWPAGAGSREPPVQEQPRRHVHRRHRESRRRAHGLGAGLLRGRLQQRRPRRPVRHLLGRLRSVAQPRQRKIHRRREKGRRHHQSAATASAAGIPAARSWITTTTAIWTCSSPTTSISIRRPRRCPNPARACYKGIVVACGPPGLKGGKNILFHNNGDGTFTDVSEKAGILKTHGTYGLGVLVSRLRQRRLAGYLRSQRFDLVGAVQEQSRRHVHRDRHRSGRGLQSGRQAAGRHGRFGRGLRLRRQFRYRQDQLRRRYLEPLSQPGQNGIRGQDLSGGPGQEHALSGLGRGFFRFR